MTTEVEATRDALLAYIEQVRAGEAIDPGFDAMIVAQYEGALREDRHFAPVEGGEWIRPPLDTPFLFECCDCGLVHAMSFDHDGDGRIIFSAVRAGGWV